jgi:hypothetical protein
VQLEFDVLAQLKDDPVDGADHDSVGDPGEERTRRVQGQRQQQHIADRSVVHTLARYEVRHVGDHVSEVAVARRPKVLGRLSGGFTRGKP